MTSLRTVLRVTVAAEVGARLDVLEAATNAHDAGRLGENDRLVVQPEVTHAALKAFGHLRKRQ